MTKKHRIRTPLTQWWQRVRYQYLPFVTFAGSIVLVLYLWQRQLGQPNAVGEVSALRVDATSPSEGKLIAVPGDPLRLAEEVTQGQVLALLDDGPLLAELAALQVELLELQGEIPATIEAERLAEADRLADQSSDLRREQADAQRARIDLAAERRRIEERLERLQLEDIQRRAEALVYRVTFEVQSAKAKRLEELAGKNLLDLRGSVEAFDAQAARDEAQQGLEGVNQSLAALAALRKGITETAAALDAYERTIQDQGSALNEVQERERLLTLIERLRHDEELLYSQWRTFRAESALQRARARYASQLGELARASGELTPAAAEERTDLISDDEQVTSAIEAIRQDRAKLAEQLAALGPVGGANLDQILAPVHATIDAKCRQIELVCAQYEALEVRAPVTGTIAMVWARPGQTVAAGAPIATIAAPSSDYILSYIRQENPLQPELGMTVEVRPRRKPLQSYSAAVARVGPQVELIPEHQRTLRTANQLEWGLPVWINVPADGKLRPGELVDLRFHARPTR